MSLAYYEDSYPPELWETPAAPVGAVRAQADRGPDAITLVVASGTPGSYSPDLKAGERPRNVTELREQAQPATSAPWEPGQYVLVGTTGKRCHWDGDTWQYDAAPERSTVPGGTVPDA